MIQKIAPVAPEKSSKSNEIPAYEAYRVEGDNAAPPIVRGPSKREIKKNPPNRKAIVNTNHQLVILQYQDCISFSVSLSQSIPSFYPFVYITYIA